MNKHPEYEMIQALNAEMSAKGPDSFEPVSVAHLEAEPSFSHQFEKMGCLILAGGQGTRLGFDGPKGCVSLPVEGAKSLFQLIFEKIALKGKGLPVAVMTSPLNHKRTQHYFAMHDFFGLEPKDITFFAQDMMYMSDSEGKLFYDAPNHLAQAPDGNGKALQLFFRTGLWHKWKEKGVDVVQVIPIDNPLAEPFDPELLGTHCERCVELVLRAIERKYPDEKLGVVGVCGNSLYIIEYSELPPEVQTLSFSMGNTGLFSCTMDFVKKIAKASSFWHLTRKVGKRVDLVDGKWCEQAVETLKLETFIFDLFPKADSFKIILSDRKKCFAPLKNAVGEDSLDTVTEALISAKYR